MLTKMLYSYQCFQVYTNNIDSIICQTIDVFCKSLYIKIHDLLTLQRNFEAFT